MAGMLFGVAGHPIGHSRSPVMHNAAFWYLGIDAEYRAFDVKDVAGMVCGMKAFGIRGLSITIPHKVDVMDHLDFVDEVARKIGAVNTLILENGKVHGFNTDATGAMAALKGETAVSGKRIGILGSGGAARAVAFGAKEEGGTPVIFNRSRERGEALASALGCEFHLLDEFHATGLDILVNTTPVGMEPNPDGIPVSPESFHEDLVVMDTIYAPRQTRLLEAARLAGCRTIDGVAMFVMQGAMQFAAWTGEDAPVAVMRQAVLSTL